MGKPLTLELIIQRTKSDKFEQIKNLNLWGNDLDDVSVIKELPNLEVLSLSVNRIASLRDFAACPRLTELYLRKNNITDLSEVQFLVPLKHLRVLWLWDNPCAETPNYRLIVIKMLPHLVKLDNTEVTPEERQNAMGVDISAELSVDHSQAAPSAPPAAPPAPKEVPKKKVEPPPAPTPAPAYVAPAPSNEADERPLPSLSKEKVQHSVKKQIQEKAPAMPSPMSKPEPEHTSSDNRSENILCAVLALLKELDVKSLELVKRDIDRKLNAKKG